MLLISVTSLLLLARASKADIEVGFLYCQSAKRLVKTSLRSTHATIQSLKSWFWVCGILLRNMIFCSRSFTGLVLVFIFLFKLIFRLLYFFQKVFVIFLPRWWSHGVRLWQRCLFLLKRWKAINYKLNIAKVSFENMKRYEWQIINDKCFFWRAKKT